jgi:LPXTG-motif cell wall-anchored protein
MAPPGSNLSTGVSPKLRTGIAIASAVVAGFFSLTYSGPYRWLAEAEMSVFGAYYPSYTWMATMLLLALASYVAFQVARKSGVVAGAEITPEESKARAAEMGARFHSYRLVLVVLVVGGTLVFLGGRDWIRAQRGRVLENVAVDALEAGKRPASSWVEIADGTVSWDLAVQWQEGHSSAVTYVPLLSRVWTEGKPVGAVLVLGASDLKLAHGDAPSFMGAVDELGLPGAVRAAYEEKGFALGDALVLRVQRDGPAKGEQSGRTFALIGLATLLVGIGLAVWQRRREQLASGGAPG